MIDIEKLILFKAETSKADLKTDKKRVMNLEEYAINAEINYNMDSNHILTINLDVDLLGDKVNSIPYKGIIKTYTQTKTDYWIIINIDKSLDEVILSARHWTTEIMLSMFIVDSKPRVMNCKDMLNHFKVNSQEYLQNKQYAKDLETYSNLPLDQYKNMNSWHSNFYNTVSDMQELYGAEIRKQGFEVALVDFVGSKKPVYKIEYGKNLLSNSTEEDLSIVTGVLAKGYDKLYADNIIYSGKLSQNSNLLGQTVQLVYPIRLVEEGQEKEEGYIYYDNEAEAKKELERLAGLEFSVNRVDEPKVSFDTKFLDLSLVEECKDLGKTYLNIGDTVATSIPKFNININTRIVEMTVDVLADEVTNITLSNNDISDLKPPTLNFIQHQIIKTENKFQSLIDDKVLGLESNIEQTSEKIKLEVKNTKEGLESNINQTAKDIRLEVKNTKEGLESSINQTAKDIRLEVKNTKEGLESSINQTAKDIRLEVKNTKEGLESSINQQANLISTKVDSGYVQSAVEQSVNQVRFDFSSSGGSNKICNSFINETSNSYGFANRSVDMQLVSAGRTYTLTVNGRTVNGAGGRYLKVYIYNSAWTFSRDIEIRETTDTTKSVTFKLPAGTGQLIVSSYHFPSGGDRSGSSRINWVNLTEGTQMEQWTPHYGEVINGNTVIDGSGVTINNGALKVKNKAGQTTIEADSDGNLKMNIYGNKFRIAGTGGRGTNMWTDYYDKFILEVPYYQEGSGLWIKRDTGATILTDLARKENPFYKVWIAEMATPAIKVDQLFVTGSKNCLQETKNYGERLINAYETAEYYFGDIGSGIIKNGECIVMLDDILQECINTDIEYHVFTQVYNGNIEKIERYKTYFIVYGKDNTEFSWELKAKRKGYENVRLDTVDNIQHEKIDDPHILLDKETGKNNSLSIENLLLEETERGI